MRTLALSAAAMVAFAANSLLCRVALREGEIDSTSFAVLRLASGAAMLLIIVALRGERPRGQWRSALALALYALPFAFAYVTLAAGTGALLLFGAVQITMIAAGLRGGERPHRWEWIGLLVAVVGLVILAAPGVTRPPLVGAALMVLAGIAWGAYSLDGRAAAQPVAETAGNFLRSLPVALLAAALAWPHAHATPRGVVLAVCSGAVTSGLGYVLWYAALAGLSATRAATVQLTVPVLAAAGGVLLLDELVTVRLVIAGVLILGGVALAVRSQPPG